MTKSGHEATWAQTLMDLDIQTWIRTIISMSKSRFGYPKPKEDTEVHTKIWIGMSKSGFGYPNLDWDIQIHI
jgi:hypothetical protein